MKAPPNPEGKRNRYTHVTPQSCTRDSVDKLKNSKRLLTSDKISQIIDNYFHALISLLTVPNHYVFKDIEKMT
jgi:hypothetical protein